MSSHQAQTNNSTMEGKHQPQYNITESAPAQGDLNNTSSMRQVDELRVNEDFAYRSLAIPAEEDDSETRDNYRPFLLDSAVAAEDWVSKLELASVTDMAHNDIVKTGQRLRVLVLYGSLRQRYARALRYGTCRPLS
jgi:arsenic resistance protein ArsH